MRVGLILECGPQGADKAVCEYFLAKLCPNYTITTVTLNSKENLMRECGPAASALLEEGHDRVVIVWDLNPSWDSEPSCLKKDRDAVHGSLKAAGAALERVHLVCAHTMLESWLLADERAVSEFLSSPTRKVPVSKVKHPERVVDPKAKLNGLFQEHRGKSYRYNDLIHAIELARRLPDLDRLRRRCPSFGRFVEKVVG